MAFLIPLAEVAGEAGAAGEAAGAAGGAAGAAEGGAAAGESGGAGKWLSKLQFGGGGKKGSSAPADSGTPTNSASLT